LKKYNFNKFLQSRDPGAALPIPGFGIGKSGQYPVTAIPNTPADMTRTVVWQHTAGAVASLYWNYTGECFTKTS